MTLTKMYWLLGQKSKPFKQSIAITAQTSKPGVGFELTTASFERANTAEALHRAAGNVIGKW
jgi:hypothetical protein